MEHVVPRISHSAANKYVDCAQSYKLHYIDRYRERTTTSALAFGSAIDSGLNAMLSDKKADKLRPVDVYVKAFEDAWTTGDLNGKKTALQDSILIGYGASEWDEELLRPQDIDLINDASYKLLPDMPEKGLRAVEQCAVFKKQKAYRKFTENENKLLNIAHWFVLRAKGELMVRQYYKDILPKIKRVLEVQKSIGSTNDDGDKIVGFIDAIVEWETGDIFPLDNKTSAQEYEEDSVRTSQQLALYCEFGGGDKPYEKGAFIVLRKNPLKTRVKICSLCGNDGSGARHKTCAAEVEGKRCNGAWTETLSMSIAIQVIIDKVPERMRDNVMDTFDQINKAIKAQIFPRNFNSCEKPWGRCPYFNLCHSGDDSGLDKPV